MALAHTPNQCSSTTDPQCLVPGSLRPRYRKHNPTRGVLVFCVGITSKQGWNPIFIFQNRRIFQSRPSLSLVLPMQSMTNSEKSISLSLPAILSKTVSNLSQLGLRGWAKGAVRAVAPPDAHAVRREHDRCAWAKILYAHQGTAMPVPPTVFVSNPELVVPGPVTHPGCSCAFSFLANSTRR